jgi:hypothetical protein
LKEVFDKGGNCERKRTDIKKNGNLKNFQKGENFGQPGVHFRKAKYKWLGEG